MLPCVYYSGRKDFENPENGQFSIHWRLAESERGRICRSIKAVVKQPIEELQRFDCEVKKKNYLFQSSFQIGWRPQFTRGLWSKVYLYIPRYHCGMETLI